MAILGVTLCARAEEDPFLTTYTHEMEEPGNLEVGSRSVTGKPGSGNRFVGVALELEYSLRRWWTTEMYLDGQSTSHQSTVFTGYRWENRFRLLSQEHWINPVLYFEYEDIDGADKTLLEVVGYDNNRSLIQPNRTTRSIKQREIEGKVILGSTYKGWTIAENLVAEKNVRHQPFEFGYTWGISRPLARPVETAHCSFCAANVQVGVEMFGGLGTANELSLRSTAHYVAPVVAWTLANGTTFRVSPGVGITNASSGFLLKLGFSYGFDDFGREVRGLFRREASPLANTTVN